MRRVARFFLGMLVAGAVVVWALTSWSPDNGIAGQSRFMTAAVEVGAIRRSVTAIGSLTAVSTVQVSASQAGQVIRVMADFNEEVTAGQALAMLNRSAHEARLEKARAELAIARATLSILDARLEESRRHLAEAVARCRIIAARTEEARIRFEAARTALGRARALAQRGAGTTAKVEAASTEQAIARSAVRQAEAEMAAQELVIRSAEASVKVALAERARAAAEIPRQTASVSVAEIDLEQTMIRAPDAGIVIGRNLEIGQTVSANHDAAPVFSIAGDLSRMEIHASIDESDIAEITVGQEATFTVDAMPGRDFRARVRQIRKAPRIVQGVVNYTVVLDALNPGNILLPGMTCLVRVVVEDTGPVSNVPLAAISFAPDGMPRKVTGSTVWLVRPDGGLVEAPVTSGPTDGSRIAVSGPGIHAGTRVAIATRAAGK